MIKKPKLTSEKNLKNIEKIKIPNKIPTNHPAKILLAGLANELENLTQSFYRLKNNVPPITLYEKHAPQHLDIASKELKEMASFFTVIHKATNNLQKSAQKLGQYFAWKQSTLRWTGGLPQLRNRLEEKYCHKIIELLKKSAGHKSDFNFIKQCCFELARLSFKLTQLSETIDFWDRNIVKTSKKGYGFSKNDIGALWKNFSQSALKDLTNTHSNIKPFRESLQQLLDKNKNIRKARTQIAKDGEKARDNFKTLTRKMRYKEFDNMETANSFTGYIKQLFGANIKSISKLTDPKTAKKEIKKLKKRDHQQNRKRSRNFFRQGNNFKYGVACILVFVGVIIGAAITLYMIHPALILVPFLAITMIPISSKLAISKMPFLMGYINKSKIKQLYEEAEELKTNIIKFNFTKDNLTTPFTSTIGKLPNKPFSLLTLCTLASRTEQEKIVEANSTLNQILKDIGMNKFGSFGQHPLIYDDYVVLQMKFTRKDHEELSFDEGTFAERVREKFGTENTLECSSKLFETDKYCLIKISRAFFHTEVDPKEVEKITKTLVTENRSIHNEVEQCRFMPQPRKEKETSDSANNPSVLEEESPAIM